ncbi:MAG: helix-turn-helix domain-containing protein [Hamadaea sp.]|uniref:IclR family transcriptional regulator n=1 Tax=Hamadaea sp. TaxID=2024425 RepID=UPI001834870D|nr:helix-turn-helix domain-containing protein [Hamadaea sp.]NUR73289.1 helix-turn-helix domain-containing protein [Hamadaea sp.]NUT19399.1 helix-turn-helix domain-containing protein [Hamadaea sp.]
MREPRAEPPNLVQSVSRALRILEAVGREPNGLSVKQIASRCDMSATSAYHLVRTLHYEGYLTRLSDGAYTTGLEVADRFRELVNAFRGPSAVGEVLRRAAWESGYSHFLGSFVDKRIVITAVAEGRNSPYVEDLVPGFDEGAHATALGKSLLNTLNPVQRRRYLELSGLRRFTRNTLVSVPTLEADLARGERLGMQIEIAQYRPEMACGSVLIRTHRDEHQRYVIACATPAADLQKKAALVRTRLQQTAQHLREALAQTGAPTPITF